MWMPRRSALAGLSLWLVCSQLAVAAPRLPGTVQGIACDARMNCVANDSPGGKKRHYEQLAARIRAAGGRFVVNGYCGSGCAILADMVRPRTCITARASFAYHQAEQVVIHETTFASGERVRSTELRYSPNRYSPDLQAWINARGGEPTGRTLQEMLKLPNSGARRFFPACDDL